MTVLRDPEDHLREAYRLAGRPLVRAHIQQSIPPRTVVHRGSKLHLHPYDNFTEFRIWLKGESPEEAELNWLSERLKGLNITAYDIGANAGVYSLFLASILGEKARILAFEPNPVMFARLLKNVELNGYSNIDLHQVALSSANGPMNLIVPRKGDFATNLGQVKVSTEAKDDDFAVEVMARRLHDFAKQTPPDYIKIDVEGHEPAVLMPFLDKATKAQLPTLIQLEKAHDGDWSGDLWNALAKAGYTSVFQTRGNTIMSREET